MKKISMIFFLLVSLLSAGLINGVAVIVNEKAITLSELQNKMDSLKVSKDIAIGILVEEKLYEEELRKNNITLGVFELEDHIKQIAQSNNMEIDSFKKAVTSQYGTYEAYVQDVRKNLLHSKLVFKIARGNLNIATKEDLKLYYDNNIHKFSMPKSLEITEYFSQNQQLLLNSKEKIRNSAEVSSKKINLEMTNINPELRYMLLNLKDNELSNVINVNNGFVRLEIMKRNEVQVLPFNDVEDTIFQEVMMQREQSYLKEYFDKLKISADIVVLR